MGQAVAVRPRSQATGTRPRFGPEVLGDGAGIRSWLTGWRIIYIYLVAKPSSIRGRRR